MYILVSAYAFSETAIRFYLSPLVFEIFSVKFDPYPLYAIFFKFFVPYPVLWRWDKIKHTFLATKKNTSIVVHVH